MATCWLIDGDKVATTAHSIILFADHLEALKIRFPCSGEERGVSKALFHPRFSRSSTTQMATQAMTDYIPQVSLQKNNAVVLITRPTLPDLSIDTIAKLIQKNSVPQASLEQGMGGSLSELDLAMVIQTITNARKEGILVITDERNRTIARIFCQDGKILHAQYGGLLNEYALYQIFESKLDGNFHFRSAKSPDWLSSRPIQRPADMLLIESHRRYDELPKMQQEIGGAQTLWLRLSPELNTSKLTGDSLERAKLLWPVLDGTTPANELWRLAGLDDYSVFQTLAELRQTPQIAEQAPNRSPYNRTAAPIPVAVQIQLKPYDEIESLTVEPSDGRPSTRRGSLLGSLREADPNHLVHNLVLSPESSGCPMFKDGHVIGMHCGSLPPEPDTSDGTRLQQMLWVDVILQCLAQGGEATLARKLSQSAIDLPKPAPGTPTVKAGCSEVARVNCSKCGASHLESSRFCKTCGQKLISDIEYKPRKAAFVNSTLIMVLLMLGIGAGAVMVLARAPQPNILPPEYVMKPEIPWVTLEGKYNDPRRGKENVFQRYKPGVTLRNGTNFYMKVNVDEPSYIYVFHQSSSGGDIDTLFPPSQEDMAKEEAANAAAKAAKGGKSDAGAKDLKLAAKSAPAPSDSKQKHAEEYSLSAGDYFTCPSNLETSFANIQVKQQQNVLHDCYALGDPSGAETFIAVSSHTPFAIYGDQEATNAFFANALKFLKQHEPSNGIEIEADLLKPGLLSVEKRSSSTSALQDRPRSKVFLTRLAVLHK
ncbi:MAG TPA: DUF4388 domain-containing protein [Candidatus Melainabacteria bacterium]|nr:DUF4388 domain-containing protein [Candidatus Melainabacteria bacterium]HIN64712.1 DUF4388 domain-containing protein [Candidatus Obscuribacterales bacterium]